MSGGIDSAACAHFLVAQGYAVTGIFVNYGQAALRPEKLSVARMCTHLGISHQVLNAAGPGQFATGELVARNAFLAFSAVFLGGGKIQVLSMGLHGGTPYYDCSPAFAKSLKQLIAETTNGDVVFVAPFIEWSKADVYAYFCGEKLPIELTYSCEAGTIPPCGACLSCLDRRRLGC
jgi:7-cyano-7-deazaguanine synthase